VAQVQKVLDGKSKSYRQKAQQLRQDAEAKQQLAEHYRLEATKSLSAKGNGGPLPWTSESQSYEAKAVGLTREADSLISQAIQYEQYAEQAESNLGNPASILKYLDTSKCSAKYEGETDIEDSSTPMEPQAQINLSKLADLLSKETLAEAPKPSTGVSKTSAKEFGVFGLGQAAAKAGARCSNNCSDHGVCKNGVCYCEPGYHGTDCSQEKLRGSIQLGVFAVAIGAGFSLIFAVSLTLYLINSRQYRGNRDMELGARA